MTTSQEHTVLVALDDFELIKRFKNGEKTAFDHLVSRYWYRVHNAIHLKLRNDHDAQEITQDVFIRVYKGVHTFRGDSLFWTWLYRIAMNLSNNYYFYQRRRKRHMTLSLDKPIDERAETFLSDVLPSGMPNPSQLVASNEFVELVDECVMQLGSLHQEILILRMKNNASYEELSCALGLPIGTVKSRVARARSILLKKMRNRCPDLVDHELRSFLLARDGVN